jgi:hypothetical protein
MLADAGEELIGNTFVVINDFKYVSKEEIANKTKKATGDSFWRAKWKTIIVFCIYSKKLSNYIIYCFDNLFSDWSYLAIKKF